MMNTAKRCTVVVAVAVGSALAGCGAPTPAVPAVDIARGGSVTGTAPMPVVPPAPVAIDPDGVFRVSAGGAATVVLAVAGSGITVVELDLADGWQQVEDDRRPREIDLTFVQGSTVVSLDAELDDGRFETDVDVDASPTPGEYTYQVGEAGSVTVAVAGDRITLVGQETAPGWVATVDERELAEGEVEMRFRADGAASTVDLDADIDEGRLNVDIDTRTGRDYTAPPAG